MKEAGSGNLNEVDKFNTLQDIKLINESILSILLFIPAIILLLRSSFQSKKILENQLNNITINFSPTPVELAIIANKFILIGVVIAADVAVKRFSRKSHQNLNREEFETYRIFVIVAIFRIIAAALALFANRELSNISEIKVSQQL
jgi:hypothetical protein